jgi:hypothetical protein
MSAPPTFRARRDAKLRARIMTDRALTYDAFEGAASVDRPKHVHAGSGISWSGERMVLIQDDADYIALIDERVTGLRLKSSAARPGQAKSGHLELEAVLAARDWRGEFILAFGSGSTAGTRGVARIRLAGGETELSLFETKKLYAALEELPDFAITTLNIEGAALLAKGVDGRDGVRLFQRANGKLRAPSTEERRLCATVDVRLDALLAYLDRCKRDGNATFGTDLGNLRRYDLDDIDEVPCTFTDAAALGDGRIAFLAAAERSEDAGIAGECLGTSFGVIDLDGSARYTIIVERDGQPTRRKAEGLAISATNPSQAFVVVDSSAGERPATLCAVDLSGV